MPSPPPSLPEALIAVPTAVECFYVLGPLAALFGLYWLLQAVDVLMHRFFPTLDWERQLGWLNLRAERRASAALRVFGHILYAFLAIALLGIAWGAVGFRLMPNWNDPDVMVEIDSRLPAFFAGLGVCLLYLGGALLPRLRREYERGELEDFRGRWDGTDDEEHPHSRLASGAKSPVLPQPRRERRR